MAIESHEVRIDFDLRYQQGLDFVHKILPEVTKDQPFYVYLIKTFKFEYSGARVIGISHPVLQVMGCDIN